MVSEIRQSSNDKYYIFYIFTDLVNNTVQKYNVHEQG